MISYTGDLFACSLNDGRVLAYGTMDGEGQPQTQAVILWHHLYQQLSLSDAVAVLVGCSVALGVIVATI